MNNPIVQREFVALMKTRKAANVLLAVALLSSLLVLLRWPTDALVDISGEQTRQVFRIFGYGMLATLILLSPVFPATSIVRERNSGTLALLLNSPLRPHAIFLGKLFGALIFVVLLLTMSLPAAAALTAMGGVELTHEVLALYGILLLVAVQYTVVALWVSSYATSADSALRWTYGWVLAMSVLALAPHFFTQGTDTRLAWWAGWLRSVSPIPAMMELLGHGDIGSQGFQTADPMVARFLQLTPLLVLVFSGLTVARLNYRIFDRSRSSGVMTEHRSSGMQWVRRLFFLVDPQRRKAGIGRWTNPVMVKEFRCRRFGRSHWLLRLAAVSALVSLGLTYASTTATMERGVETIGGIMVVLQVALVVLLTPSLAAPLISGELESGGWVMLKMTPLTAGSILRGKLLSVLWTLLLILVSTLPGYLVMVVINPDMWIQVQQILICLLWTALFSLAASATVSTLFTRASASTTVSYVILMVVYAGTMLVWLGRDAPFGHRTVERVLTLNPMAAALSIIQTPGFTQYDLVPANWWWMGGLTAVLLLILLWQTRRLMQPA
jgi:ABC-type transport system involved in multi-copper enzyme maturation permease subunit